MYSNQNLDWHYCDVLDFEWENRCYAEAAKKYNDLSICDNIKVDYAQAICIQAYVMNQNK